mmetsp:Transcript_57655/g.172014  ORF Transcript_57655/g.172014 Transcript_57655/m.172014 type:complete len:380 (-) Transcript_57655:644-1783(-)
MEREFDFLVDTFPGINVNTTATSEHVPEIERMIRVIKEHAGSIRSKLPYKRLPNQVIIEILKFVLLWLNALPPKKGVSSTYIPRTIMTGLLLDWQKHSKEEFGEYCEVHEDHTRTNSVDNDCTRNSICLGTTANFQGSYTLLCLDTGKCITRKQFMVIHMPKHIISRVEELANHDQQVKQDLVFKKQHGNSYDNGVSTNVTSRVKTNNQPLGNGPPDNDDEDAINTNAADIATDIRISIPGVGNNIDGDNIVIPGVDNNDDGDGADNNGDGNEADAAETEDNDTVPTTLTPRTPPTPKQPTNRMRTSTSLTPTAERQAMRRTTPTLRLRSRTLSTLDQTPSTSQKTGTITSTPQEWDDPMRTRQHQRLRKTARIKMRRT